VVNRNPGEIFESAGDDEKVISHTDDAWIRVETRNDRVDHGIDECFVVRYGLKLKGLLDSPERNRLAEANQIDIFILKVCRRAVFVTLITYPSVFSKLLEPELKCLYWSLYVLCRIPSGADVSPRPRPG
jgi:hypothetical protein